MGRLEPGDPAPAFTLPDQAGRPHSLADRRGPRRRRDLRGAWGERSMYGKTFMGIIRSAFLVDEEGRIAHAWYKVVLGDTVPNARAALAGS